MSLGDGLARGLKRYMWAKSERGLRSLLVGDTGCEPADRAAAPNGPGASGNGNRGGNGTAGTATATAQDATVTAPSRMDALGIQWQQTQFKVRCPDCQGSLRFAEGCVTCDECGFSEC